MRGVLVKRLRSYWKMEAANVLFVPAFAVYLVHSGGDEIGWLLIVAMLSASALLIAGSVALRAHYLTVAGDGGAMARVVPVLARSQLPLALLSVAGVLAAGVLHWQEAAWTPSVIAAWVLSALATLEYVNYYHIQLQHFDHAPDRARLLAGKGFRASHLARAIRRYRAAN